MIRSLVLLAGASSLPASAAQAPQAAVLEASAPTIDVRDGARFAPGAWTLTAEANPDVYTVRLGRNERRDVCFESAGRALCRTLGIGDAADFVVRYQGRDYPQRFVGTYLAPAATFDAAYRGAHRGKVTIVVPEVYELVNVAIALTPIARETNGLVYREGPYHAALEKHFAPVADHPFVRWLDAEMRRSMSRYARHKMNAHAFEYDVDGRVVRSAIYDRTGFENDSENTLLPKLAEIDAFSRQSNFRAFYAAHAGLYAEQVRFFREETNSQRMLTWLARQFPAVRAYDHVKIVFSPLVYGYQSATWIADGDFRELQPHINFPYPSSRPLPVSAEALAIQRGNLLFTELNHGFINPTAEGYAATIDTVLASRPDWVAPDTPADGYGTPVPVFNEMMNWGLVDLYYVDHAPAADLDTLIAANRRNMAERRGFIRFPEFSAFLVDLYRNRPAGTTIADLYPRILRWFADHPKAPAVG